FAHHHLGGLGGRLPVYLASVIARNVLPDSVKIAPAPFSAAFDAAQQRRQRVSEFVQRKRRGINDYFPISLQAASLLDETERESAVNDETADRVDSTPGETAFDSSAG